MKLLLSSKLAVLLLVAVSVATSAMAQSGRAEVEILQDVLGLDKKVAVTQFLKLGDDAKDFWALYDEYEVERKKLGIARVEVLREYAKNYSTLTDDKILDLYKRTTSLKTSFDKLQNKYFMLMRKKIGMTKAAQFWQFESYINVLVQSEIYTQVPFIGENINKK